MVFDDVMLATKQLILLLWMLHSQNLRGHHVTVAGFIQPAILSFMIEVGRYTTEVTLTFLLHRTVVALNLE